MRSTILLITIILATAFSAAAECSDADKKALAAFDTAWGKAGESGDKTALMSFYADEYVGFPGMQGKHAAIEATMDTFARNKANPAGADKVTYDHYIVSCTPMTATVTHRNTVWTPHGAGGKPETFYTRSVHFLEKRGGNWQVVSNAGNDARRLRTYSGISNRTGTTRCGKKIRRGSRITSLPTSQASAVRPRNL